jgi:Domain of unknown function (DUF4288)
MNWYLAKVVFQVICGNGNHTAQFDEQLRLIEAADEQEAFYKAQQIGVQEADVFLNDRQQLVQWKFIDVCELHPLNELINGAEMYSRITEVDSATQYIETIHRKADGLQGADILRTLQLK